MKIDGNTSDGYHTFNELYEFRMLYNALLFNEWYKHGKYNAHKSWKHHDGNWCFDKEKEWFIVCAMTPAGMITNHYSKEYWDLFLIPNEEKCLYEFDGHTSQDVAERLHETLITEIEKAKAIAKEYSGLMDLFLKEIKVRK